MSVAMVASSPGHSWGWGYSYGRMEFTGNISSMPFSQPLPRFRRQNGSPDSPWCLPPSRWYLDLLMFPLCWQPVYTKVQCILEAMCVTVDFWYSAHYSGFCIKLLSILGQIKAPGLLGETLPWKDDPLSALWYTDDIGNWYCSASPWLLCYRHYDGPLKDINSVDMNPFPLLQSCKFWVVRWTVQVINLSPSSNETLLGSKLC